MEGVVPRWRVIKADKSSKVFMEDEFKAVLSLVEKAMKKEVKVAQDHIKRIKR